MSSHRFMQIYFPYLVGSLRSCSKLLPVTDDVYLNKAPSELKHW